MLVTFEGKASDYTRFNPQDGNAWVYAKPNAAQAMLVHNATSCAAMQTAMRAAASARNNTGLVYATDVKAAGDKVKGIKFSESNQAVNTYPIATMDSSKNKELANAFIDMVTGSEGKKILGHAGFGTP